MSRLPGGKLLFSRLLGKLVPYSGTIKPNIEELRKGYAKVSIKDRRAIRNHLNSVHAIALVNLGELASGLALIYSQPDNVRGIVKNIDIEYLKKARGKITAISEVKVPKVKEKTDFTVTARLYNEKDENVANVNVRWVLDLIR